MQHRRLVLGTFILVLLLQTTLVRPRGWTVVAERLVPIRLSGEVIPHAPLTRADLDQDGVAEELTIMEGEARLLSGSKTAWQSPPGWQVIQAEITDLDRDGAPEVTLLVWRPFRPWPVDEWLPEGGRISGFHDAAGDSCQIILIGWQKGGYRELWAGSALAEPVRAFAAADLDGDGRQELITLDGRYSDPRTARAHELKVWEWNGFGFSNVFTLGGRFAALSVVQLFNEEKTLILVP